MIILPFRALGHRTNTCDHAMITEGRQFEDKHNSNTNTATIQGYRIQSCILHVHVYNVLFLMVEHFKLKFSFLLVFTC